MVTYAPDLLGAGHERTSRDQLSSAGSSIAKGSKLQAQSHSDGWLRVTVGYVRKLVSAVKRSSHQPSQILLHASHSCFQGLLLLLELLDLSLLPFQILL